MTMKDLTQYPLLKHNTFGIDAKCDRFIEFTNDAEAIEAAHALSQTTSPYLILGGGSNLLLTGDYHGTVAHSAIKGIQPQRQYDGDILLRVGSGENWDQLVAHCVAQGWHGMENLSLIPGDVGASAVQNIGAYGSEAKDLIIRIEAIDIHTGRPTTIQAAQCDYSYRHSKFKAQWRNRFLITHVTYRLYTSRFRPVTTYGNVRQALSSRGIHNPTPQDMRQLIIDIREEKLPDPKTLGNGGSFFMNPIVPNATYQRLAARHPDMPHFDMPDGTVKIPAGWLIEQCGWKGKAMGRAAVHAKQALVLVNLGGATGAEVLALCQAIRASVSQQFGIDIQPEVNIIQ